VTAVAVSEARQGLLGGFKGMCPLRDMGLWCPNQAVHTGALLCQLSMLISMRTGRFVLP